MRKIILIQARLSSSRFPGKMLQPVKDGIPLAEYVWHRCSTSRTADEVAVITSSEASDDLLYDHCVRQGIPVYRGPLDDVLERYRQGTAHFRGELVCRVCGDSPFVDVPALDALLDAMDSGKYGYGRVTGRPAGRVSEAMTLQALETAAREAETAYDREHVTPYLRNRPDRFPPVEIPAGPFPRALGESHPLTVDRPDDMETAREVAALLEGFRFTLDDVAQALIKTKGHTMDNFTDRLLEKKRISLWGFGYLGYSSALLLHARGFHVAIHDTMPGRLDGFLRGEYPSTAQAQSWSLHNQVPTLDPKETTLCTEDPAPMFQSPVHLVTLSGKSFRDGGDHPFAALVERFTAHPEAARGGLVLFQSADEPGTIGREFCDAFPDGFLERHEIDVCGAFRNDWSLEEFSRNGFPVIISTDSDRAYDKAARFYRLVGKETLRLGSVREGELLEAAQNTLDHLMESFFNQLALAYPNDRVRDVVALLARKRGFNASFGFGLDGYRAPLSVRHLIDGAVYQDEMTLVRDAEGYALGNLLKYADFLLRKGCTSVLFLGYATRENTKRAEISATGVMAEYLAAKGVRVFVDDPLYTREEIRTLSPTAEYVDILSGPVEADGLVVMARHHKYARISREEAERLELFRCRYLLDNTGLFRDHDLPENLQYHRVGDGTLDILD